MIRRPASYLGVAARCGLAAAGGAITYLGVAPSTWWWAPIIGFTALGLSVRAASARLSALVGLVFGALYFLPLLTWSGVYVGKLPWAALALAEAVLVAPATALIGPMSRRLPAWPAWAACAWLAGETLRSVVPFGGFPWGGIAFTQADGPLLPLAALLGEYGITAAVVLIGFTLAELIGRWAGGRRFTWFAGFGSGTRTVGLTSAVLLIALPVLGAVASRPVMLTGSDDPHVPIAVVQGNVPELGLEFNARRRAVLNMHAAETERLVAGIRADDVPQPAFVLWPENASDIDPYRNPDAAEVISESARAAGVPILVGAVVQTDEPGRVWNMGIVWDPATGPGETYIKRHPVPFGEYMPMRGFFRIFSDKVDLLQSEFLPGNRPGNLTIADINVGDVICFEIVEDGIVRDVVTGGAQLLVVQTNNATFGYTNETYQQQAMSRIRAVEFGRSVLIAATSGVSAVIAPDGSVQGTIPLFTAGHLVPEVPLISGTTPGTVLGAPVTWISTALAPVALAASSLRRRRSAAGKSEGSHA